MNLPIRVAHFPPYCSKHNPIEHRLFPHVTRSCSGVIFETLGVVKQLVARTTTRTGLTVTAAVLEGEYQNGRKAAKGKAAGLNFQADEVLPRFKLHALTAKRRWRGEVDSRTILNTTTRLVSAAGVGVRPETLRA